MRGGPGPWDLPCASGSSAGPGASREHLSSRRTARQALMAPSLSLHGPHPPVGHLQTPAWGHLQTRPSPCPGVSPPLGHGDTAEGRPLARWTPPWLLLGVMAPRWTRASLVPVAAALDLSHRTAATGPPARLPAGLEKHLRNSLLSRPAHVRDGVPDCPSALPEGDAQWLPGAHPAGTALPRANGTTRTFSFSKTHGRGEADVHVAA